MNHSVSLLIGCLLLSISLQAQMPLRWFSPDSVLIEETVVKDSAEALDQCKRWTEQYWKRGYPEAGVDHLVRREKEWLAYGTIGQKYHWAVVQSEIPGYQPVLTRGLIQAETIYRLRVNALRFMENQGYPSAEVGLRADSIVEFPGRKVLYATLWASSGPQVFIDSVRLEGQTALKPVVIKHMLGLQSGVPFKGQELRNARERLNRLEFMMASDNPKIWMQDTGVVIVLPVKKRKANQFSGIVGLVPVNDQTGDLLLTGDVRLKLHNFLQYAEMAELNWQRLQRSTQQLNMRLSWPYLIGTPLGVHGNMDFFRIDTAYYQLLLEAGLNYRFRGTDEAGFFLRQRLARNILQDGKPVMQEPDASVILYGLRAELNRLNHPVNPQRGWQLRMQAALGIKNIRGDSLVDTENWEKESLEWQATFRGHHFLPLGRRMALMQGVHLAWMENPYLFTNDLFRLGGLYSLRGFDESSLFLNGYFYGTLEWRLLLDEFSYISLFSDAGWISRNTEKDAYTSAVLGVGGGLSFDTPAGQFSVLYAIGSRRGYDFDFQRSKLHFGYVARF